MGKTYFASDFHLGIDTDLTSLEREKIIVKWLEEIRKDASAIYLLGDIFDYWFEYRRVIPKGFSRLLGKISSLTDQGIDVHWIVGNHDMWTFGYLEKEIKVTIHKKPLVKSINGKNLFLAHGDGLGNGDFYYLLLKRIFTNRFCQFLFSLIPSALGLPLMKYYSRKSRIHQFCEEKIEILKDQILIDYCENLSAQQNIDYFVMGHRHRPNKVQLSNGKSQYINLGDWISHFTYAVLHEDGGMELKKYKPQIG